MVGTYSFDFGGLSGPGAEVEVTTMQGQLPEADFGGVIGLEDQLAAALSKATTHMARLEYMDDEQRAEIYTILQAMQTDTEAHRCMVGQWVDDRMQGAGNA